jgi:carbon-monoxide dehydrogenase large subunit
MSATGIGAAVRRKEDRRFITGTGHYTDDINRPGQAYAYFLRSPHAHAAINSIDVKPAAKMPGVLAVLIGAELAADKIGNLICGWMIHSKDGSPMKMAPHPALANGKVCHVGDALAVVVAETLAQARDAAEKIVVDYAVLPAVADPAVAQKPGAPRIHDIAPNNTIYQWHLGDAGAVEAAFRAAKHVTRLDIINNRLVPNAIEPRAAIGDYDAGAGAFTLWNTTQNPHVARLVIAAFVGMAPEHKLRVIAPDVGGGFGSKIFIYPEEVVALWASKRVGRPVKWVAERSEAFVTDAHGRDHVTHAEMAFDGEGKILGLRAKTVANLGAYMSTFSSSVPTYLYATLLSGQYEIPNIYCEVDAVYTNTVPVDAYRGAGRPEATFVVERLVEVGAREMGQDPAELRRKNFIKKFPHQTPVIMAYDAGDYNASLKKALELADFKGFARRKRESARDGKLRGIGYSTVAGRRLTRRRRRLVGIRGGSRQSDRQCRNPHRLSYPRPGPRDHVRTACLRTAWHPDRQYFGRARRYRQGPIRDGHLRLALRCGRDVGAGEGARQDRGQGKESRCPYARSRRGRHRIQGRKIQCRRHRQIGGLGRRHAQCLYRAQIFRSGARARLEGRRVLRPDQFYLPGRLPHLRSGSRPGDRKHRNRRLDRGR